MSNVLYYTVGDDLTHHGILGMKWGQRNGPPYPLGASDHSSAEKKAGTKGWSKEAKQENKKKDAANRDKYKVLKDQVKKSKEEYEKAAIEAGSMSAPLRKDYKDLIKQREQTERAFYLARRELTYEKAKDALDTDSTKKSKRQLTLEQQYKEQGMSDEEAAVWANRRAKIEKYVAIAGTAVLAGALSYAVYKNYKMSADSFIKSNDLLYRVTTSNTSNLNDLFYVAGKKDAAKYVGLYGGYLHDMAGEKDIYQKTIKSIGNLKVASEKNAAKIFGDTVRSNPKFASYIRTMGLENVEKSIEKINDGKASMDLYKQFNTHIKSTDQNAISPFLDNLKKAGYGAIYDYNDRWQSGYNAKSATIILDKSSAIVENARKIPISELNAENGKQLAKMYIGELAKSAPLGIGSGMATTAAIKSLQDAPQIKKDRQIVQEYRREHPNSKLSYNEILKNYNR